MSHLESFTDAFVQAGGSRGVLADTATAHLFASGHTILSMRNVPGLEVDAEETASGITAKVRVLEGVAIQNPVHLCFGILHATGTQRIIMDVKLLKNSSARFIAHCIFPRAEDVRHIMDAVVEIAESAELRYSEVHYHGPQGGIEVIPKAVVTVGEQGRYYADFSLTTGRVGKLDIDYTVETHSHALAELVARVFGHDRDTIAIMEKVILSGKNSRGLIKTRIAIEHEATAEVTGITEGNAEDARGHVDCMEIVKDNAVAKAVPVVRVTHPRAKVTHEAAIGSLDRRQMETLMAHGLSPDEAADMIVKGILR